MDLKEVKNIIFDLGGVILNLNFQLSLDAFQKLSKSGKTIAFTQAKQSPIFDDYETGRITDVQFRAGLRTLYDIEATDAQIDEAWNALLLDIPEERITLLQNLSKKYRLFLMSNTNAIHLVAFTKIVSANLTIPCLDSLFEKTYYSHVMGQRKPDAIVFEQILEQNKLKASETLFIDDSIQHIQGADKVGLKTLHLVPPLTINEVFKNAL